MNNVVFPQGIRAFSPNEGAPEWVKGTLKVNRQEFTDWLTTQQDEITLNLKESKKGGYYLEVSTYKK